MTVAEQIKSRVNALGPAQQEALLRFLETLNVSRSAESSRTKQRKRKSEAEAAVNAIAGMWKDRTDLPKDSVAASKILRRRLMGRHRNG